ncbi:MAG TPA: alpha/beta hydrolase [Pseudomonadales bacterium]|nr:alpha/beta hydrolase [Pseudomonadales bacterium]
MATTLIVPGLRGSGDAHWQTWFEQQLDDVERVHQADWEQPDLASWSQQVIAAIDASKRPVWLVAHSFGVLASVVAIQQRAKKVAGAMLVAPADPEKFGIETLIPNGLIEVDSVVVASTNDPWLTPLKATYWADRWGSRLLNLGRVGHINVDSGFGPWPEGLAIYADLINQRPSATARRGALAQQRWSLAS